MSPVTLEFVARPPVKDFTDLDVWKADSLTR
jgi:hypothetical protein